jgi:hypothetical protein
MLSHSDSHGTIFQNTQKEIPTSIIDVLHPSYARVFLSSTNPYDIQQRGHYYVPNEPEDV